MTAEQFWDDLYRARAGVERSGEGSEQTGLSVSTLSRLELLLPLTQADRVPLDDLAAAPRSRR